MFSPDLSTEDTAIQAITSQISAIFEDILNDKSQTSLRARFPNENIDVEIKHFKAALVAEAQTVPTSCSHPIRVARALQDLNNSKDDFLDKLDSFKNEIEKTEFDTFLAKNLALALLAAVCIAAIFTVYASVAVGTAGGGFCFGLPVFLSLTALVSGFTLPIAYVDWGDQKQLVDQTKTQGAELFGFFSARNTSTTLSSDTNNAVPPAFTG